MKKLSRKGERRKTMGEFPGRFCASSRDGMKKLLREGARRREMGGRCPPNTPARGAAPPLDPPLCFKRGAHASLSVASLSHCSMDSKHGRDE